jgi:hypothetical protein
LYDEDEQALCGNSIRDLILTSSNWLRRWRVTSRVIALIAIMSVFSITPIQAQDDVPTEAYLPYNTVVADTITDQAIYDTWYFTAGAGSVTTITMQASEGLAPLIGVVDQAGDLIARSDFDQSGNPLPTAQPDSTATLAFTAPAAGDYAIVATRVGNEAGTTTGAYTLHLRGVEATYTRGNERPPVELRCGDALMTVALVVEFDAAEDVEQYRISVYGLGGFQPAIHVLFGSGEELHQCTRDAQEMPGDRFILPGEDPLSLPEEEPEGGFAEAAQLILRGGELLGPVQLALGSIDHQPGRYMMVIEGFTIPAAGEDGVLDLRLAPWAQSTDLLVYMIAAEDTRIDPYMMMEYVEDAGDTLLFCDDAGRADCEDVPAIIDAGVIFNDGTQILGDRFDAGLRLAPGDTRRMQLTLSSRARSAHGNYALIFIGELPPREGTSQRRNYFTNRIVFQGWAMDTNPSQTNQGQIQATH